MCASKSFQGTAADNDIRQLKETVDVLKTELQVVSNALNGVVDAWNGYRSAHLEATKLLSQSEREQQNSDGNHRVSLRTSLMYTGLLSSRIIHV